MTWAFNYSSPFSKKKKEKKEKERKEKAVHFAHEEKKKVRVVGVRVWQQPKQVVEFPDI